MYLKFFPAGSVNQDILNLLWIFLKWRIQRKIIFFTQRIQNRISETLLIRTGLPSHDSDCPFADAKILVWNHQIFIEFHLISQSKTLWACTEGIIERKTSRFNLINADTTVRTRKTLAEIHRLTTDDIHNHQSLRKCQNILNRICQPLLNSFFYDQSVYNNLDIMLDIFIQSNLFRQFIEIAIHPHTDITAFFRAFK